MTLEEILKSQGLTDEQIKTVTGEMKQNKIFTSSEENMDIRFGKLNTEHQALINKDTESQKLIKELQEASKGQEGIQAKISEYEQTIKNQQAELEQTKIESALKVALLGAKATDVDYLAYKIKAKGESLKLDEKGNISGIDNTLAELKKQYPTQFESSTQKKFEEKQLPGDDGQHDVEPKNLAEALKMEAEKQKG